MAEINCVDGSRLGVVPVPVLDRRRVPYEVTLRLTRDGQPFGDVGERCGYFLTGVQARLAAAREDGSPESARWPVGDRFPAPAVEAQVRSWAAGGGHEVADLWSALAPYLPRDRELFAFRGRDPDDLEAAGELRCTVHTEKTWIPLREGRVEPERARGRWQLARRAVLDAWGEAGTGLRAVLDSTGLAEFLRALLDEIASVGAALESVGAASAAVAVQVGGGVLPAG